MNGQEVNLTVHYENGFTLSREEACSTHTLFLYPFEKLRVSADDGIRNLYLDFGGPEGELVRTGLGMQRDAVFCGVGRIRVCPLSNYCMT